MANDANNNPVRIDTFGSDVTVKTGIVGVKSILATALASAKTVTFIDSAGGVVFRLEVASGTSAEWTPNDGFDFPNGLIFDDSASDFAANDMILVYLK